MSALVLLAALGGFAAPAAANDDFEPNDAREEAAAVSPGEYEGLRIDDGESDFFAIALEEGESLTTDVRFDHDEGDLDLAVYGSDGGPIATSGSMTDHERAEIVAEESGTYYVEVYGFGGASADYDLSLAVGEATGSESAALEPDRFEPNDNSEEAASLEEGTHAELTLESGDRDFFAVALESGERATVDLYFDHSESDIDLAVVDSNQNILATSGSVTDDERATFTADSAGTYYVVVHGYDDAPAEYDLELSFEEPPEPDQFEPNGDFEGAASVEAGRFDELVVGVGDRDYYAVELEEGEMLDISLQFSHADADVDLAVYDSDQRAVAGSASVTDGESATVVADGAGTYYVEVYAVGGSSAEYEMELAVGEAPEGDRFEPNDNLERAVPLSEGTYENLSLFANDADVFTVYLAEGQQFDATATFDHEESDIGLVVVDESESLVDGADSTVSDDEHLSFEAPGDGVYYVVVFGYQAAPVGYELDVRVDGGVDREGWLERNGEFRYAVPLEFGDEVTTSAGDETNDYYAVELAEGETATVRLDANESGLELVPYGPDREYLTGADQNEGGSEVTFTADADGVYYVVVTGDAEASYDLSVSEETPDAETEPEENATDTESAEESDGSDDPVGDQTPGFGPVASALALLAAALFAARRR